MALKKPTLDTSKALEFAVSKKSGSSQSPVGDTRLAANIRKDLHSRLKIHAAKTNTTIGELLEDLIESNIP